MLKKKSFILYKSARYYRPIESFNKGKFFIQKFLFTDSHIGNIPPYSGLFDLNKLKNYNDIEIKLR